MSVGYREKALAEYGEHCHVCGEDGGDIVVHHRNGDRRDNSLENLIPVCAPCHGKIHGAREEVAGLVRELGNIPRSNERMCARVTPDVADELHDKKNRGESYDDVLRRMLDMPNDEEEA